MDVQRLVFRARILLVLVPALAAGCEKAVSEPAAPVFYPPPPDPPRLQFLTSFSDPDEWAGARRSSFADFIVGAAKDTKREFMGPYGLGVWKGKLYICDLGAHCVHVIDTANRTYRRLGSPGEIKNPVNITIAADGVKYVCDSLQGRVLVYDADDRFVRSMGNPRKCIPSDLAELGGELVVADVAGGEVEVWSRDGKFLRLLARKGKGPGQLSLPTNVAVGPGDRIFVSDTMASIINVYDKTGRYIGSVGMPGDRPGYFARPKGIAIDPNGLIYAADAQWEIVQLFAPDGKLLLFFGGASPDPHGMGMPAGLAIDRTSLPAFRKYVHTDFEPEYLLFVANQFGKHKIGVYAFGRSKTADYSARPRTAAATRPAAVTTRPAATPQPR